MLPIKMTISGFCSYMEETTFDFTKLGVNGIYLVTGETGAGKTTIFDAIIYALYGTVNGDNREVKMLRNITAPLNIPTFVEFEFKKSGDLYVIRRNPTYLRQAKKGNGTSTEKASVCLTLPDGTSRSKDGEVLQEIIGILGIDANQFSQIAMIAQGQFQKVLTADTKERGAIFRHIFKTEKYQQLEIKLKEKTSKLIEKNKAVRDVIDTNLNSINLRDGQVIDDDSDLSNKLIQIQDIINSDNENQTIYITQQKDAKARLLNISTELGKLEEKIKIYNNLEIATSKKVGLDAQLIDLDTILNNEKAKEPEIKSVQELIKKAENSLPKYEELEDFNNKLKKSISKKETSETKLATFKENLVDLNTSLLIKKSKSEELKDSSTNLEKARNDLEKLKDKQKLFVDCFDLIGKYKAINVSAEQSKLKKLTEEFNSINDQYKNTFNFYIKSQAGILAKDLKENSPCLVCGSTTHPKKAELSKDAPTQIDVDDITLRLEQITNKVKIQTEKTSAVLENQKNAKDNICNNVNKILSTSFEITVEISVIEDSLNLENSDLNSSVTQANDLLSAQSKLLSEFEKLQKEIPNLEDDIKNINTQITNLDSIIVVCQNDIAHYTDDINKIGDLEFESLQQAKNNFDLLQKKLKTLESELEIAQSKYNEKKSEIDDIDVEIKVYNNQLEDAQLKDDLKITIETKLKNKEELLLNIENIEKYIDYFKNKINNNKHYLSEINKNKAILDENDKSYSSIVKLSECANGQTTLETFVQTAFFDNIIARANLRFYKMSDSKFMLVRQEQPLTARGKAGLDLDVIDMINGDKRSVKSLSGGESFMASISLALGLSDEIQSNAGGIELDALFIDEGFGSLDTETLNIAINILQQLSESGKIIGMISHVEKLKERIDKQIIVKKIINSDGVPYSSAKIQV